MRRPKTQPKQTSEGLNVEVVQRIGTEQEQLRPYFSSRNTRTLNLYISSKWWKLFVRKQGWGYWGKVQRIYTLWTIEWSSSLLNNIWSTIDDVPFRPLARLVAIGAAPTVDRGHSQRPGWEGCAWFHRSAARCGERGGEQTESPRGRTSTPSVCRSSQVMIAIVLRAFVDWLDVEIPLSCA